MTLLLPVSVSTLATVLDDRAMDDRGGIARTLTLASGLSVALGVVMAAFFFKNSAGLLSLMGAPPEVMGLAVPYLRWRASALPANLFLLVACGAFRCVGTCWVVVGCFILCRDVVREL